MLETRETLVVSAPVRTVWGYVSDIRNWATNMPGYESCDILSEGDSRWTLTVTLGALQRRVSLLVHVTEWRAPHHAAFTLKGEADPVEGSGTFDAEATGEVLTTLTLKLTLSGSGPLAGAMEAMTRRELPRIGRAFAEALKREIEALLQAKTS